MILKRSISNWRTLTKQSKDNPYVHSHDVQIALGEQTPEQWTGNGAHSKNQDLQRMSIFSSETERSREFMMKLVNFLVELILV